MPRFKSIRFGLGRIVLVAAVMVAATVVAPEKSDAGWGYGYAYRPAFRPVVRPVVAAGYVARRAVAPVVPYRYPVARSYYRAPVVVNRPVYSTYHPVVPAPVVPVPVAPYYSGYRGGGVSISVGYGVAPVGYIGY